METDPVPGWVRATHHLATRLFPISFNPGILIVQYFSRLKYLDPVYTTTAGEIADIPDPEWLAKLEEAVSRIF